MPKTRLLIVDDEVDIRDTLARYFRLNGYEVETATDGHDALRKLEDNRFDIAISDIMMPRLDGIELLRRIRSEYPMMHVIMITGHVTQENVLACMRRGADACLFKPLKDLSELDEAVHEAEKALKKWQSTFARLLQMTPEPTA